MGAALQRHLDPDRYNITIVTRRAQKAGDVEWDGRTMGPWTEILEGSDVAINLAGRRVHCRYNSEHLKQMMDSRIDSTRVLGQAISVCKNPPNVWLQASTATLYAHSFDRANDERTGTIGGSEPGVPAVWNYSIEIGRNWERSLEEAATPSTRKVAMRSAIMMGIDKDSAFDIFSGLTKHWLGGRLGNGRQYVSWIHEADLVRAVEFLIDHAELSGPVNLCSPNPLPQAEFAKELRTAWNVSFGLPAMPWMVKVGAWAMNGDSELVMKSRRVIPGLLQERGFEFRYPSWPEAARDLVERMRAAGPGPLPPPASRLRITL